MLWFMNFFIFWMLLVFIFNIFPKKKLILRIRLRFIFFELFFNQWKVFSPTPIKSDLKLYYRDLFRDGRTTELKEIKIFSKNSFMSHRERAFLSKIIVNKNGKNEAYEKLQEYIKSNFPIKDVKTRQICIVRSFGFITDKKESIELIDYIKC